MLLRLLVAYLMPTLGLLAIFGFLTERVTRRALEASLGRRLVGIAQATSAQIRPAVIDFLSPGDDDSLSARRLRLKLERLRKRTHVARIFVLDVQLRSKADTAAHVRIGDRHYNAEADRSELERVFRGEGVSSVLFKARDGRRYKTGYAPLLDGKDGKVVAAVGIEASPEYFVALERLRTYLLLLGAVIALLIIAATVLVARRLTRPLRHLAVEAARIGRGELEGAIAVTSADEVGLLASTMNEMRRDLHARDQEMQLMLSGIAHEVRNPLGGIALFAGLLREEVAEDADQLEMVQRIERELEYLGRVVNDFLAYARKMPLELSPVGLKALARDVVEVARGEAELTKITIDCQLEAVQALGDAEHLRRVLLNLLGNAIHASEPGGKVVLRSGEVDKTPFIEVEDEGSGIAEEVREKIFAPFFTTREKGTGLGLALSQKIVNEHGGRLELDTEVGRGTRIRLLLRPVT